MQIVQATGSYYQVLVFAARACASKSHLRVSFGSAMLSTMTTSYGPKWPWSMCEEAQNVRRTWTEGQALYLRVNDMNPSTLAGLSGGRRQCRDDVKIVAPA